MSASIPSTIRLPLDTGNTGPRTKTSTVQQGADQVHRHHFVRDRNAVVLGIYSATSALLSIQAAAQNGIATGFLWVFVPTGITGKGARLRRLRIKENVSAATPTMPTLPRVGLSRFTYTGTPGGAQLAGSPLDTTYPNPVLEIRTAPTGMTPTLVGSPIAQSLIPPFLLAGTAATIIQTVNHEEDLIAAQDEDDFITLAPGQGGVLWQMDAGTTADIRRLITDLTWDEVDLS